jgi:hypothetical protein
MPIPVAVSQSNQGRGDDIKIELWEVVALLLASRTGVRGADGSRAAFQE